MVLGLKLKKSAGVPVTAAVHRLIAAANAARARSDWRAAAKHYDAALRRDPHLGHVWIQLGHALKESGELSAADRAYHRAESLRPDDADAHLHLGHVAKLRGDVAGAIRSYLTAARLAPKAPHAIGELHTLIANGANVPIEAIQGLIDLEDDPITRSPPMSSAIAAAQTAMTALVTALKQQGGQPGALERATSAAHLIADLASDPVSSGSQDSGPALIFDVSDLLTYFRNVRSPTGIQRVQIEIILSSLQSGNTAVRICCFLEQRDEWVEIPAPLFLRLSWLSLGDAEDDGGEWTAALTRTLLLLNMAPPLDFPRGAFLINLGTSWWLQNYFLFVRRIKRERGVRYIPFVHDMIPVLHGEFCPKVLTQDFISWAIGVFEHADFFFVNSQSTRRDLIKVGAFLGREIDPLAISVVTLDADTRKPDAPAPRGKILRRWGLNAIPYVLFVSTIEPRKNHLRVFEAWIALLKRHGSRKTPKLVCVGHPGWLNDSIHDQLNAHEDLRAHVQVLRFVSDADLAELYSGCLFTLYPSHYEGWGLPVTESLCYGKAPLVANTSSLPEAGGRFAVYFNPDSTVELIAALETLAFDHEARRARERLITAEFKPRGWAVLARQMADDLVAWEGVGRPVLGAEAPAALVGAYHSLGRNLKTRVWPGMRSGEVYRSGPNWWGPDNWGCWTKPGGSTLRMTVPQPGPIIAYLHLQGLPAQRCGFVVKTTGDAIVRHGEIDRGQHKWLAIEIAPDESEPRTVTLEIEGTACESLANVTDNSDARVVSLGVAGFFLCRADDPAARAAFLEAVAIGNIHDLDFSREPLEYTPLIS
uniref:Glycosyl transferase group 1 n=1 Tax=Caulobacter sp. (strain K31) TaxID=366602 RepID=B0T6Z4_CAUSK